MDPTTATIIVIGLGFIGVLGLRALSNYLKHDAVKITNEQKVNYDTKLMNLAKAYQSMENSRDGYRQKYKFIHKNYDLDYDDLEWDLEDDGEDLKLSELARSIYPKLPPSLAKLIDKDEFQNAIIKTVEKKPDIITTFIDKFINKPSEGSTSNSAPRLEEKYL